MVFVGRQVCDKQGCVYRGAIKMSGPQAAIIYLGHLWHSSEKGLAPHKTGCFSSPSGI
jgi:hypothetical protein